MRFHCSGWAVTSSGSMTSRTTSKLSGVRRRWGVGAGAGRQGSRRRLFFFLVLVRLQAAVSQPAHKQFELGRVQLFALLPKEAPGQGVELLAQQGDFAAGLLQLLAEGGVFGLEQSIVHFTVN